MKSSRSKRLAPLFSFLLPILFLTIYFVWKGITPFGGNTFLIHDMNAQYIDFFAYLRTILNGENDMFYSLSRGLGGPFPAFFAYYLICPLDLIPALLPERLMPMGISLEMMLLFGAAGLSCFICIRKFAEDAAEPTLLYFSTAYSLSGWMLLNAENFQFIQETAVLPMVIMALDDLKEKGRLLPVLLWLTAALVLNFYIGAMIWLFALLWYFIPDGRRPDLRVFIAFGAAAVLSAPVWLPVLRQMGTTIKQADPLWFESRLNFTLPELLKKFLPGQFSVSEYQDTGRPAVYCGMLTLAAAVWYFFRGTYTKGKNHRLTLLLVMYVSLTFRPLTMLWHGFSEPHWWPYRFSFLLIFLLVLCAAESRIRLPFWLLIPFAAGLFFNLDRTLSVKLANAVPLGDYTEAVKAKGEKIRNLISDDGELFRIGDLSPRTENDPMHFDYSGISSFDSLSDRRAVEFLSAMGFPGERYSLEYGLGNTAFANALLGVRYVTGNDEPDRVYPYAGMARRLDPDTGNELAETDDVIGFQKAAADSIGLSDPFIILDAAETEWDNLECNDEFCMKLSVTEEGSVRYTLNIPRDGFLYACRPHVPDIGVMTFRAGGREISSAVRDPVIPLMSVEEGDILTVELSAEDPIMDPIDFYFVLEDTGAVEEFFTERTEGITVKKVRSSELKISLAESDVPVRVLLTLPYDSGWKASFSGGVIRTAPLWDTFTVLEVPAGVGEVDLKYRPY